MSGGKPAVKSRSCVSSGPISSSGRFISTLTIAWVAHALVMTCRGAGSIGGRVQGWVGERGRRKWAGGWQTAGAAGQCNLPWRTLSLRWTPPLLAGTSATAAVQQARWPPPHACRMLRCLAGRYPLTPHPTQPTPTHLVGEEHATRLVISIHSPVVRLLHPLKEKDEAVDRPARARGRQHWWEKGGVAG